MFQTKMYFPIKKKCIKWHNCTKDTVMITNFCKETKPIFMLINKKFFY